MNKADRDQTRRGPIGTVALLAVATAFAAPAIAGDAKTTATTVCAACHGADGNSVIPNFPKIGGLQEDYIAKQLKDFMSGRRKSDIMAPIVAELKPEDIGPLAAYFAGQKLNGGQAEDRSAAGLGKMIFHDGNEESGVPACVGCHQSQGSGYKIYPRIGGQHSQYVVQQLKNFAAGERSNDTSRYMRVTAQRMSEEEIRAVAEYLAGLGAK